MAQEHIKVYNDDLNARKRSFNVKARLQYKEKFLKSQFQTVIIEKARLGISNYNINTVNKNLEKLRRQKVHDHKI